MGYIALDGDTIADQHICCAISDKKCAAGTQMKKDWLTGEFAHGYAFRRLDARGKVFIEYGPAERAWMPVTAPDWVMLGCFWVSGQFARKGHAKALLGTAIKEARAQGKAGLVAVVGTKKFHFMSDGKWLLRQGFVECDRLDSGFSLLALDFGKDTPAPQFNECTRSGTCTPKKGIVAYYSNRCPFTEFHLHQSLTETCEKRGLALKIIKLDTLKAAQSAPSPATIFSLFKDGKFVTTDLSACMDSRFDKVVG